MNVKPLAGRLLSSNWLLALLPTLIIIALLPPGLVGKKYSLKTEPLESIHDQVFFEDLDGDGITEQIDAMGAKPLNNIHVTDNDFHIHEQWNLADQLHTNISVLYFNDYDHDHLKEIYVFTVQGDSIFLNANEFFDSTGLKFNRLFITTVKLVQDAMDSNLLPCGMFDRNGDGNDELYFGITSGFSLEPRLIYSFDLVNRTMITSPYTSININEPKMMDIDGDNRPEIFGMSSASGNHHFKTPYSDYSAWLMVFDDQLQFKFPPVEFPGFGNSIDTRAVRVDGKHRLLVAQRVYAADTADITARIGIYSTNGVPEFSMTSASLGLPRHFEVGIWHNKGIDQVAFVADVTMLLDVNLRIQKKIELPSQSNANIRLIDLDADGTEELVVHPTLGGEVVVFGPDLEEYDRTPLNLPPVRYNFSKEMRKDNIQRVFLKAGDSEVFLKLERHPYYFFGYLIWPAIYLFFFAFVFVIRKVNTDNIKKREEMKRSLLTMQLRGVKGQLNPHFTFNALNSIASLLYLNDREAAYDALNNFTRLLRQVLADADRIYRTLNEEVEFVKVYLDLEHLRFGDKFRYEIKTADEISGKEEVPILVLHTFAENAVKHGLMHRTEGGLLSITIEKSNNILKLTIEDNGVGRARTLELNPVQGKGLKITTDFYEILNQMGSRKTTYAITDVVGNSGHAQGTRVEVFIKEL